MILLIGLWSHALAATLFGALAVWQLRHWNGDRRNRPLVAAFAVTSLWAIFVATLGGHSLLAGLGECARNFAFLAFMYGIAPSAERDSRQRAVKAVYCTVAAVIGLQIVVAGLLPRFSDTRLVLEALTSTANLLGLIIAAGSLVLVHNLYGQAAPDARDGIRLPMIALAIVWMCDLHLYTVAYLTRDGAPNLLAMRGAITALTVPLFALASRRTATWKMRISRAATFQSLSLIAILIYLVLMMSATRAIELVGGGWVRTAQLGLILLMTVAAAILLPSRKARAWLRVMLAKHFFEHRYDYRGEWLRFTQTIGRTGGGAAPLRDRIIKALADIAGSPAGVLLSVDEQARFTQTAAWNWPRPFRAHGESDRELVRFLETTGHVVDFEAARNGSVSEGESVARLPDWLSAGADCWAGIPLLHADRLVGLILLAHPLVRRPLDWEDFDLFRAAGTQAASYLAEARSQEALADVQRFDEFNRRFAFIMHDIKNLVSQLSLVARNAERHADNPEFRADMVATLQSSVKKMNDLLARLSRGNSSDAEALQPTILQNVAESIAAAKRRHHPIELFGNPWIAALADPGRLEQALGHIVQNAMDASRAGEPVRICYGERGGEAVLDVIDSGPGMSAEFIRTRLFQPFSSTKEDGFGIGAFEARTLIAGMGGRIEVESREGEGSRFTILLPAAEAVAAAIPERKRA
jgi:putative PEP-CTERM system histidine kinase